MYPACFRVFVAVWVKVWLSAVRLRWSTMAALGSDVELVSCFCGGEVNIEWMRKPETEIMVIRMAAVTAKPKRCSLFFSSRILCFIPRGLRFLSYFTWEHRCLHYQLDRTTYKDGEFRGMHSLLCHFFGTAFPNHRFLVYSAPTATATNATAKAMYGASKASLFIGITMPPTGFSQ